jgi:uncharacterized membrane protein YeaQ/YmgE (transglycosylase-associated protein family)
MHILIWILFGLAVGVVAKLLMPGHDPGDFVITGLLGAVVVLAVSRMTVGRTARSS